MPNGPKCYLVLDTGNRYSLSMTLRFIKTSPFKYLKGTIFLLFFPLSHSWKWSGEYLLTSVYTHYGISKWHKMYSKETDLCPDSRCYCVNVITALPIHTKCRDIIILSPHPFLMGCWVFMGKNIVEILIYLFDKDIMPYMG